MPSKELIKQLEKKYLELVMNLMEKKKYGLIKARECSKLFLSFLPFKNYEDMDTKIATFVTSYPEFHTLIEINKKLQEHEKTHVILDKIKQLSNQDETRKALEVLSNI